MRNNLVDLHQRVVLGVQAGISVRDVEKTHLAHARFPTSTRQTGQILTDQAWGQGFFEVPINISIYGHLEK